MLFPFDVPVPYTLILKQLHTVTDFTRASELRAATAIFLLLQHRVKPTPQPALCSDIIQDALTELVRPTHHEKNKYFVPRNCTASSQGRPGESQI